MRSYNIHVLQYLCSCVLHVGVDPEFFVRGWQIIKNVKVEDLRRSPCHALLTIIMLLRHVSVVFAHCS